MHIWYFNHYAGGPGIGPAMRAYHLARYWGTEGHETTVFLASYHHLLAERMPLPREQTIDGVRYCALPTRIYAENGVSRLLNMLDFCVAMRSVNAPKPDAIIVSSPHPFAIYPAKHMARKHGAKLVFEVRDLWPLSITDIAGKSRFHPIVVLSGLAERYAYRHSDVVASLLEHAESHMTGKGLLPGKFLYVPNGIDTTVPVHSRPVSEVGREAAKKIVDWQSEGRAVIIHPGSQGIPNALDKLIDAVALLEADCRRFGVLLVGSGSETGRLKHQTETLGLSNIAFFPRVPKDEALWLTAASDIGYAGGRDHPAVYRYGTSFNKITDFLRFGLPFIEVVKTGFSETTKSDQPHCIAERIRHLLDESPDRRRANASAARDIAMAKLNYTTIARRYLDALR